MPTEGEPASARTTVRRRPHRGEYHRETIEAVLDEGLVAHVGVVVDGAPAVVPTTYARVGDILYLHGARTNRVLLQATRPGAQTCVTVTLLDGLVLARAAVHHSMNYRSVVVVGQGREVVDLAEKRGALRALVDHVLPGRSDHARPPHDAELATTLVAALSLQEASAKVRTGPPLDDDADLALPVWAGVVPLSIVAGIPQPAPSPATAPPLPDHVTGWRRGPEG